MKKHNSGFTLIEVLVVASLVAVVALLMYSFFGQGFSLYSVQSQSADEQMGLRQTLSEITNRARLADDGEVSVAAGVLTVGSDTYELLGGRILRNGSAIASDIAAFDIAIENGMLRVRIVSGKGTRLDTSLSLVQP